MSLLGNLCSCLQPQDRCVCALGDECLRNDDDNFNLDGPPDCCMCGDSMDHGAWSHGHTPVSMRDYYADALRQLEGRK